MPNVSIIMSNYNTPITFLREAVDSILNQSYSDFEFIIIDDHSKDESYSFLNSLSDRRILLYRNPENYGLTKSLNKAIELASGKYMGWISCLCISLALHHILEIPLTNILKKRLLKKYE